MNQFLKNHQLNKAEICVTDVQFQIELVVYKIISPLVGMLVIWHMPPALTSDFEQTQKNE